MRRERPLLVETLFADPVWLCSVGHGCVCGDGCSGGKTNDAVSPISAGNQTTEVQ